MKLQLLIFVTECVIVVQSQLSRQEFERQFFSIKNSTESLYVNNTGKATKKMSTLTTLLPSKNTKNVTVHVTKKISTQTPKQITRSTLLTTLLPTTPSPTLVITESSTSQHKKFAEKYSSMSFMDFMNVSGMGELSLTALLRKFFAFFFVCLFI